MTINEIKRLQQFLCDCGFKVDIDGKYGLQTRTNFRAYVTAKLSMKNYTLQKGYQIVYIRTDYGLTNTYDDFAVLFFDGNIVDVAPCSTTAGRHYVMNPLTVGGITGTAVAIENQIVKGCHKFVTSSNWKTLWLKMPYFQQIKPMKIYRDGNKDNVINKGIITEGLYGINLHRGGLGSLIERWSAGCQIVPDVYWNRWVGYFKNGDIMDFILIG
jgi:hypothetical protein